jgi:hypothetical protein
MEILEDEPGLPEDPHRIVLLLQTLVRGLALANDRFEVKSSDLDVLRHVAFPLCPQKGETSSVPPSQREGGWMLNRSSRH